MAEQETKTFDATQAERNIEKMIDRLKGLCSQSGLGNQAGEEEVITNVFIYKFLNDKMLYNLQQFADDYEITVEEVLEDRSPSGYLDEFYDAHGLDVRIEPEQMIGALAGKVEQADFPVLFDDTLEAIAAPTRFMLDIQGEQAHSGAPISPTGYHIWENSFSS